MQLRISGFARSLVTRRFPATTGSLSTIGRSIYLAVVRAMETQAFEDDRRAASDQPGDRPFAFRALNHGVCGHGLEHIERVTTFITSMFIGGHESLHYFDGCIKRLSPVR